MEVSDDNKVPPTNGKLVLWVFLNSPNILKYVDKTYTKIPKQ